MCDTHEREYVTWGTRSPPHMKQRSRKPEEEVFQPDGIGMCGKGETGRDSSGVWRTLPPEFLRRRGKRVRFLSCDGFLEDKVPGRRGTVNLLLKDGKALDYFYSIVRPFCNMKFYSLSRW